MGRSVLLLTVIVVVGVMATLTKAAIPGGISDNEKAATPELKTMLVPLEPALNAQISHLSNGKPDKAEAVSYKTQVVAGTNYFIKFRAGNEYFHARVFRGFQGDVQLVKVIGPKKEEDPILYFDK